MIRTYLDWLLAVPWAKRSEERLDPVYAREVLDADHAGSRTSRTASSSTWPCASSAQERGIAEDKRSGAILTLIGPPGTGKTSIGESIARALNREFVRMSLGGVRDEAEIRGHRRTYIGALPGRLVRALRDAGTMNPVILLDEVDKVGADWRGDPSAALLEVLDPAQNHSFRDHYLDVELDLSEVVFIATANVADTIPGPLLDRMEVIRFDGYTVDEKVAIARGYLWPRQRDRAGLLEDEVAIARSRARARSSRQYTREAGVRQLERELGKLLRKTATKLDDRQADRRRSTIDEPALRDALGKQRFYQEAAERTAVAGVATGLAVTGTGGDVLFVEATRMKGGEGLVLTGQLGDVMKESARIALSYVHSHAGELGIDESAFDGSSFHVHVPAGAIPKDGPSAGITMTTALASLLTGRPVKHTVGMTGEVTLQGRVLPIGGLKQKALAAHAAGLTDVIIPERNRADLDDIPEDVRERDDVPPGDDARRGARAGARAGSRGRSMRCRSCTPLPEEVRRAADLLERRWTPSRSSSPRTRAPSASTSSSRCSARCRRRRSRAGWPSSSGPASSSASIVDARPPRVEYHLTARSGQRLERAPRRTRGFRTGRCLRPRSRPT